MSSKSILAQQLGIARSTLYYQPIKPHKDWFLKTRIEEVLRMHPSYGSRRIAIHLKMNRKPVRRVMKIYGIKPYRRRTKKKYKKPSGIQIYPNLLMTTYPSYENHIWASDFTHIRWNKKDIYLCTVIDLYSRIVVGYSILTNHTVQLVILGFLSSIQHHPIPEILHSDNGSEYDSKDFKVILNNLHIQISRSKKGCPWENGYQESFYDKFKVDSVILIDLKP